jgi:hypothetical protein
MKELTRDSYAIVRARRLSSILLAVFVMIALIGKIALGFAHGNQDPAQPQAQPSVTLSPDSLLFADQVVRRTSAAKRITVRNTGGQSLYIDSVTITGDNPNSFAIANDTCTGATVDANKACIVDVTFTPTGTGERNARVKFSNNAPDSPQRLRLKGNGINSNDVAPF